MTKEAHPSVSRIEPTMIFIMVFMVINKIAASHWVDWPVIRIRLSGLISISAPVLNALTVDGRFAHR